MPDDNGLPDLFAPHAAMANFRAPAAVLFAFDLLHLNGEDWRPRPLAERQARLTGPAVTSEMVHETGGLQGLGIRHTGRSVAGTIGGGHTAGESKSRVCGCGLPDFSRAGIRRCQLSRTCLPLISWSAFALPSKPTRTTRRSTGWFRLPDQETERRRLGRPQPLPSADDHQPSLHPVHQIPHAPKLRGRAGTALSAGPI